MFRRTKKVMRKIVKTIKVGAFITTVTKAGLWIYSLAKEKPKTEKEKTKPKKSKRVKIE